MQYGWPSSERRSGLGPLEVQGMATYRMKKESRAASADGVVVRSHAFRHKPVADLAFWSEAVRTHLLGQGYVLQRETDLTGAHWLEWAVPSRTEDLTYVTVIYPMGRRIEVIEAAGTAERVEQHRDAILQAVQQAVAE